MTKYDFMYDRDYRYYVYIMASISGVLYVGVTNDLIRRTEEHKQGKAKGFTSKYHCTKLIYYEHYDYVYDFLEREKQINRRNRSKKENLIKTTNPKFNDLYEGLF